MKKEDYIQRIKTDLKLRNYSELTLKSYLKFIEPLLKKIKDPTKTTLPDVQDFLASLYDRYNGRSRALAVSSIKYFFKRIVKRPEIYAGLDIPKKAKTLPTILTQSEIKLLINATKFQKTRLIINLLYATGLRVSELVNLKPLDLEFTESTGWVREGKGNKDRLFRIPEKIKKELEEYIEINPNNKYLFSEEKPLTTRNIQYILNRTAKKASIRKKVTPHTLRHSFATHLYESGEDLLVIQRLLGHESLETTKIYTYVSQARIKKVKSPLDSLYEK